MPLESFSGNTFVAFTDIAGFKQMMKNEKRAYEALDALYSSGYDSLQGRRDVNGLFISDCGVLYSDGTAPKNKLISICQVIESLHRKCFERGIMLTTSIAYGEFKYEQRLVFPGIEKHPINGLAYIKAYKDNESGDPKIYAPEARIVKENLPEDVMRYIEEKSDDITRRIRDEEKHYYFDWMKNVNG